MPTFSFDRFVPLKYLVRTESRDSVSCQRMDWETGFTEVVCENWKEAQELFEFAFEAWKDYVRSVYSDPEYWIRTRDCFVGEWTIDAFHSNALHPRKFAVDCQIYVCFTPKDPAERDVEWGESDVWMTLNHRLFTEIEAIYGLGTEPDPEPEVHDVDPDSEPSYAVARDFEHYEFLNSEYLPEPEPEPSALIIESEDNWFVVASDFLDRLQTEPDPESQQYEPETIIIPIPSWEWVETEPEQPEPEPIRITRGYLYVRLYLHDQIVVGRKSYNLPLEREHALGHAKQYTKCICDLITHMLGVQPETDWEIQSPNWGDPTNAYSDWCEWTYLWGTDYNQCGVEKAVFEWGFDHNFPPIEWEEKESWVEPLWLGCITIDLPYGKRSTCLAHDTRFAIGEWIKGSVDAYALISGRNPDDVIGRYLLTELDRAEATYRDINVTVGDLVGEGIRLI